MEKFIVFMAVGPIPKCIQRVNIISNKIPTGLLSMILVKIRFWNLNRAARAQEDWNHCYKKTSKPKHKKPPPATRKTYQFFFEITKHHRIFWGVIFEQPLQLFSSEFWQMCIACNLHGKQDDFYSLTHLLLSFSDSPILLLSRRDVCLYSFNFSKMAFLKSSIQGRIKHTNKSTKIKSSEMDSCI